MKKIMMYVLVFGLSAVILTGCRGPQAESTTTRPSTTTAAPTTKPTTAPTTAPSSTPAPSSSSGAAGRMPMMPRY